MTKTFALLSPLIVMMVAGCASAPTPPAGLVADRFVSMSCAENKSFQVRYARDGRTIRVRSHAGSAELERQPEGRFAADGFTLEFKADGASLDHAGKNQGKSCKVTA